MKTRIWRPLAIGLFFVLIVLGGFFIYRYSSISPTGTDLLDRSNSSSQQEINDLDSINWNTINWHFKVNDFDVYKNELMLLVDLSKRHVDVHETYNFLMYSCHQKNKSLSYKGSKIQLTPTEQQALDHMENVFTKKDAQFDVIRVYENCIVFGTSNGQYSLIYVEFDHEPTFLNTPDETHPIRCEKIEDHWYHVIKYIE